MSNTVLPKIRDLKSKARSKSLTKRPYDSIPGHPLSKHATVPELLHQRLLELPFDAYARLIALLLERLGYEKVVAAGRTDWKGRNHSGGTDLLAALPGGLTPRRVVVQLKQFDSTSRLFQRHIDELCGVAIRSRASEALLITTGPVSSSIHFEDLISPLLPIRLIAGDQLLALLVQHGVGVTKDGALDVALFDHLTRTAKGNSRDDCPGRPEVFVSPEVLVTLEVVSRSKKRHTARPLTRA